MTDDAMLALAPFAEFSHSRVGYDPTAFLETVAENIADPVTNKFILEARRLLQFNNSVKAEDLLLPLRRRRWPATKLRETNWAISEIILGHRNAPQSEKLLYAYLGAFYVHCQITDSGVNDTNLGDAIGAMLSGTSQTTIAVQCEFIRFLNSAVAEIGQIRQRSLDPRPVLCFASVVVGARVAAIFGNAAADVICACKSVQNVATDFLVPFETSIAQILKLHGKQAFGADSALQTCVTELCKMCIPSPNDDNVSS